MQIFVSGSPDATGAQSLLYRALLGFFCYATFGLTSLLLLKHWTWPVAVVDIGSADCQLAGVESAGDRCEPVSKKKEAPRSDRGASFLFRSAAALLRLRHDADIRLRFFPTIRIDRLGFVIGDGAGDDDVFAMLPVGRRRDAMLGGHLQ
jgi:hypothetical protein